MVIFYSNDSHLSHVFLHDNAYKAKLNYVYHVYHLLIVGVYDVLLLLVSFALL